MARKHFGNFASIFVKDRFQAVNNINDLFSFLWVFNSLNKDDIKNQATTLAEIYSNQLSLEIVDEMLFLKDTYAENFKLSASPKNILAEMLEMSLIDLFPNISITLRIFFSLLFPCQLLRQNAHFLFKNELKIIYVPQRSRTD